MNEPAEITITYSPDDESAEIRCDYPGDDSDHRDDRVEALFQAVHTAMIDELEAEDIQPIAGGETRDGENAVAHVFGTEDDIQIG
jgi:hypothetical protein